MNPFLYPTVALPLEPSRVREGSVSNAADSVPPDGPHAGRDASSDSLPDAAGGAPGRTTGARAGQPASRVAPTAAGPVAQSRRASAFARFPRKADVRCPGAVPAYRWPRRDFGAGRPKRSVFARTRVARWLNTSLMGMLALGWAGIGFAVDLNSADLSQLRSVRGIGPKTAQIILEERGRAGPFRSFSDLSDRVRGIGPKRAQALQAAGLSIGGTAAKPPAVREGAAARKKSK